MAGLLSNLTAALATHTPQAHGMAGGQA